MVRSARGGLALRFSRRINSFGYASTQNSSGKRVLKFAFMKKERGEKLGIFLNREDREELGAAFGRNQKVIEFNL